MLLKVMEVHIMLNAELFNPELKRKDTKSVIKKKLIDLLIKIKGFKFVKTLVLEIKKVM